MRPTPCSPFILLLAFSAAVLVAAGASRLPDGRPPVQERKFVSEAVEARIRNMTARIRDPDLATLYSNCFPNTLDTTVLLHVPDEDTFIVTGDIAAMWLRDSTNQVLPYLRVVASDRALKGLFRGLIRRQARSVLLDAYANSFNVDSSGTGGPHQNDITTKPAFLGTRVDAMTPAIFERKYELDSLAHVLRLSAEYFEATQDLVPFTAPEWALAVQAIVRTMQEQQRSTADSVADPVYMFQRAATEPTDSLQHAMGAPAAYTGMVKTAFRPSDDAATFAFNIPANALACVYLRRVAPLLTAIGRRDLATTALQLAAAIDRGIREHGVIRHPVLGPVFAYETDGIANHLFMDDANVPSLLSLPFLGYVSADDPLYLNTRRAVLSERNAYFFEGAAGAGVGSPHSGYGSIWPMSLMMSILTSTDENEVAPLLTRLVESSAGTGFMHESFWKDNAGQFTRPWFAWANSFFGMTLDHVAERFPGLL